VRIVVSVEELELLLAVAGVIGGIYVQDDAPCVDVDGTTPLMSAAAHVNGETALRQ